MLFVFYRRPLLFGYALFVILSERVSVRACVRLAMISQWSYADSLLATYLTVGCTIVSTDTHALLLDLLHGARWQLPLQRRGGNPVLVNGNEQLPVDVERWVKHLETHTEGLVQRHLEAGRFDNRI